MIVNLLFLNKHGLILIEQPVEIKSAASYPGAMLSTSALGCWVKANGRAVEHNAGTIDRIKLVGQTSVSSPFQELACAQYVALTAIKVGGPANYPGPGLGWSMNFMPLLASWCVPAHLLWLQAGGPLAQPAPVIGRMGVWPKAQSATQTSAEIRDAFLRAVFAPEDRCPETQRNTRYITPRAQRTDICPCGVHHGVCGMHSDWLEVD
jgi:hypothetical protein